MSDSKHNQADIFCPLCSRMMDETECYYTGLVADLTMPKSELADDIPFKKSLMRKCRACEHHGGYPKIFDTNPECEDEVEYDDEEDTQD